METNLLESLKTLQNQVKNIETSLEMLIGRMEREIQPGTVDSRHIVHHSAKGTAKMEKVAKEFHEGKLYSHGHKVTNPKQMEAIAESERREMGYK